QQGCKTVIVYCPEALAGYWENNDTTSKEGKRAFAVAANVVAYATGLTLPKPRLTEVTIVREKGRVKPPKDYLQVAPLVFGGEDTLPLAPKAIPNLMAEVSKMGLTVHAEAPVVPLTGKKVRGYWFFYMHDRVGFRIPGADAVKGLKFKLEQAGLLLADAA